MNRLREKIEQISGPNLKRGYVSFLFSAAQKQAAVLAAKSKKTTEDNT